MSAIPEGAIPVYTRAGGVPDALATTEWVLTNGLGGFAMGTALGTPLRRYHGLLVAALSPPVQRQLMLHSIADALVVDPGGAAEERAELTPFRFRGGVTPSHPAQGLVRFEKDLSCRWLFRVGGVELTKEFCLIPGRNAASITYTLKAGGAAVQLLLRPLVAMRDAHALLQASDPDLPRAAGIAENGLTMVRGATRLELWASGAAFTPDPQMWYGFEYPCEQERGFDCLEDLVSPGVFSFSGRVDGETSITLSAWVGERPGDAGSAVAARAAAIGRATAFALGKLDERARDNDVGAIRALTAAADDFPVRRIEPPSSPAAESAAPAPMGCTIIAGYPWFTDWGRDAMISLEGLLLVTGRHDDALSVLSTLARHCRRGLIPNNFDDRTGEPSYNTVDASLWFLHAVCEYRRQSAQCSDAFRERLLPACLQIVDAYAQGTDYDIRVDDDGLVTAGDPTTQLTWMDAKRDGVVFTPRHGKAVEINALWHHGLIALEAGLLTEPGGRGTSGTDAALSARLKDLANRCRNGFRRRFWNERLQCLYDVLAPGADGAWIPNEQIRPNQIFAVSLAYSPLEERQQLAVVQTVRSRLLTPHGLRTLDPADAAYRGRFAGSIFDRDAAYHNGTVWPWLMGPFVEAVLRTGRFSTAVRADARQLLAPLIACLDADSLGQLPEVFDGDDRPEAPQRPGGCIAQAWSVAEVLRVLVLACSRGDAAHG